MRKISPTKARQSPLDPIFHPPLTCCPGALRSHFRQIQYEELSGFYHEVIGGLRFSEERNRSASRYIREIDRFLCSNGVIQSTEFYFAGALPDLTA
jgi:hypothetical protein